MALVHAAVRLGRYKVRRYGSELVRGGPETGESVRKSPGAGPTGEKRRNGRPSAPLSEERGIGDGTRGRRQEIGQSGREIVCAAGHAFLDRNGRAPMKGKDATICPNGSVKRRLVCDTVVQNRLWDVSWVLLDGHTSH